MRDIYLDSASTAKHNEIDDVIIDTITSAMREYWMNPSSLYATHIKDNINRCRSNIAKFINAKTNEIYFTSGASESNNWAIQGFINNCWKLGEYPIVITSSIEHKSILDCVKNSSSKYYFVNVDSNGMINFDDLENALMKAVKFGKESYSGYSILVSIQLANNEIGTCQNIKMLSDISHEYGAIFHSDATQAFAHIPIDVDKLGIDMLSASGHKISSVLRGVGFLYKKNNINIEPLIYGAQENNMRGGTENTYGIIGLNKALEYSNISNEKIEEMIDKRNYFINLLESRFKCKLNGDLDYRLPNNINVTFPNIMGESLLYALEISNIFVSTGSACNSNSIVPSGVLKAIGLSDEDVMKTIRITLSEDITYEEIKNVINEINKIIMIHIFD